MLAQTAPNMVSPSILDLTSQAIPKRLLALWGALVLISVAIAYAKNRIYVGVIETLNRTGELGYQQHYLFVVDSLLITVNHFIDRTSYQMSNTAHQHVYNAIAQRYLKASFSNQAEQTPDFNRKVGAALNVTSTLTLVVPRIINALTRVIGAFILVASQRSTQTPLIFFVLCNAFFVAALSYLIAPKSVKNRDDVGKINSELDTQKVVQIYGMNHLSMHQRDRACPANIANTQFEIERNWSQTSIENLRMSSAACIAIDAFVLFGVYVSSTINYPIWRLLTESTHASRECLHAWTSYSRHESQLKDFDEFYSRFDSSKRFGVHQVARPRKISVDAIDYTRPTGLGSFKLHLEAPFQLKVGQPKLVGVFGPNGAGKSTFFDVMAGSIELESPSVKLRINGERWPSGWMHLLSKRIVLMQSSSEQLSRQSWSDVVSTGQTAPNSVEVSACLSMAGLADLYATRAGPASKIGKLSGGETRRLLLARVLYTLRNSANDALFVLMDELDAGVDDEEDVGPNYRHITDIINGFKLWYKGTVFLALHNKSFIGRIKFDSALRFSKTVKDGSVVSLISYESWR
jgi:ABC-type multidrug transport system ATPase subunit